MEKRVTTFFFDGDHQLTLPPKVLYQNMHQSEDGLLHELHFMSLLQVRVVGKLIPTSIILL